MQKSWAREIPRRCWAGRISTSFLRSTRARPSTTSSASSGPGEPLINEIEKETWADRPVSWVSSTKMPLKDEQGKIIGTFGVSRDMTERRRMEEKNLRLAAMIESSNDAIIGIGLDDRVTSWNKGAETIFGYTSEEMIGKSITPLLSPEIMTQEPTLRERMGREGHVLHTESTVTRKDGRSIYVSTSISVITDAEGQIVGITFISRDVTDQKALQVQLIRAQRLESLGTLASGIAHQFNNINTAVRGYLDFLSQDASLPASARSYIREALKAVQRAVDITDRLQGLSTSASSTSSEGLHLEEAVPAVVALFDKTLETEGIRLELDFPSDACRERQPFRARVHRHQPHDQRGPRPFRLRLPFHHHPRPQRGRVLLLRDVGQRMRHPC